MAINTIKKPLLIALFIFFPLYSAYPIPKEVEKALMLNRINHFDEALEVVNNALAEEKIKPDITSAYTIGRILYRKGVLYREMAKIDVLTQVGSLLQIKQSGPDFTEEIKVFLGMAYFFNNQFKESIDVLRNMVKNKKLNGQLYNLSLVYLGASYYKTDQKQKSQKIWEMVNTTNPLAGSVLGYMYVHLDIDPVRAEEITRKALLQAQQKNPVYIHTLKVNHAYALLGIGKFNQAYEMVSKVNLDSPMYVYRPDQKTEMRFYDLSLLDSYSKIIFGESIKNLEPIITASSGELASFASYYVAQMYLFLGEMEKSNQYAARARKLSVVSSLTMIRAVALEASTYILRQDPKKGIKLMQEETERIYGEPSALLEMIEVLISSGVDYGEIKKFVDKVEEYIYDSKWNRSRRDNALLGELSLYTGRTIRALYYLERTRDKPHKNKIETNDPTFLLKLSYVYYIEEYFPESLEILFAMGKHFSGVRPLQDAVQTVYSYKQKGAGEAILD
ncbi:MAG: tetratricopeptide repeat protein [Spirochaetota bacterium]